VNEESTLESSLDLTLTHYPRDEDLKPREVCVRFEVDPPRAWYYHISLNFHTLVILLQVDPVFSDEVETVYEGCYETKDTSIFAWSLILGIGHYRWLRGPIHRLPFNNKVDYLVRTILTHLRFFAIMNYHCVITHDSTCNCSSSLNLSII
jgi:hypothetical protein